MQVDLYFSFRSPYSYLILPRMVNLRDKHNVNVNFKLVYLKIEHNLALDRILKRKKHFMPPSLLESQIKILEEPKRHYKLIVTLE